MDINILLLAVALLPAIVLCIYVYIKDRTEKEPIRLLLLLFVCGAISCFPAAELEELSFDVLYDLFKSVIYVADNSVYMSDFHYFLYHGMKYFICVALVEEAFKFVFLHFVVRNNKNFNSLFDGMIYAVFVSLGFAAFENVLYSIVGGWETILTRMVTAVPAHMFFGVLMGYQYSWWHAKKKAQELEYSYKEAGYIHPQSYKFDSSLNFAGAIIIPVLAHGLYDYCCMLDSKLAKVVFVIFLIFLYIHCFRKVNKLSKDDNADENISKVLMMIKYPDVLKQIEDEKRAGEAELETNNEDDVQEDTSGE